MDEHHRRHEGRAAEQQARLDDLHPRRRHHAAERDVGDHERADEDLGNEIGKAEQELDQLSGPYHLRDEIEGDDGQRAHRRQRADGAGLETERGHVGEGVAAEIAQALRDEEQHDRPAHEPAHRVDETVEAGREHEPRDAEERGRRHVVAGDRESVLEAGDAAARGVEVGGRARAVRGPLRDGERRRHEDEEHDDGFDVERLSGIGHHLALSTIARVMVSNSELARRT